MGRIPVVSNSSSLPFRTKYINQLCCCSRIMINDIQELIDKNAASQQNQQERSLSDYNYTRYHPMGEIYGWMEDIHEKHSDLVSKHYMGSTYEERPIYYLKIGWPSKKQKKIIFMDCGMHAREWVSVAYCQWFVKELISNHKHDSELNKVLKQVDFYVVPVLNVDGYVYTWTTERLWRKNRSVHDNGTCYGVDLNRNFDAQWCTVGTDPYCSSLVYCGPSPASELETKAMVTLIEKHKTEILCYLNMHSYSQLILYPYGYSSNISANNEELEKVATIAIERIMEKHKTEYAQGRASYILYFLSGASADWALDINIKLSFIFELRDDGTYGFELPPDQIEPTCEETMTAVMSIVEYIDEHYLDDYIEDNAIMTTVSSRLNLFLSLAFYIFYFVFCV
uniref:Peptidase M14 domain-containing protein n=1 Tax=Leptobrachium leishanense TaxID=445787 RepID=A0A8C5R575_9ANUR